MTEIVGNLMVSRKIGSKCITQKLIRRFNLSVCKAKADKKQDRKIPHTHFFFNSDFYSLFQLFFELTIVKFSVNFSSNKVRVHIKIEYSTIKHGGFSKYSFRFEKPNFNQRIDMKFFNLFSPSVFVFCLLNISPNLWAQKTEYSLIEKMLVGCYGANEITDYTKKISVEINGEEAVVSYQSINCKSADKCDYVGDLDELTSASLYLIRDKTFGFILENKVKLLLLRRENNDSPRFNLVAVGRLGKSSETSTLEDEREKYESLLGNLGNRINGIAQSMRLREMNKLASIDSASTFLNSKEVLKDSRGLSGIYYSRIPVLLSPLDGDAKFNAKKFLVNYVERPDTSNTIEIRSQYAYETSNREKFVPKAVFYSGSVPASVNVAVGLRAGHVWMNDIESSSDKYQYYTHTSEMDLQGDLYMGEDKLTYLTHQDEILEVEPGILLIGDFFIENAPNRNLDYNKTYRVILVLYKAEKAVEAQKYTNAYCWEKIAEFHKKWERAYKERESARFEMLAPKENFKDAPSKEALIKAAKSFISVYQSGDTFDYIYPVSAWTNTYEMLGSRQQNTLVARTMEAALVTTKGGECRVTYIEISQDNTFTTGSLSENFAGNPIQATGASNVATVECAKARKFKK